MDEFGFINLEDILIKRTNTLTPGNLLALLSTNPKARLKLTFPVYRVSGLGQRSFLIPDIGIRATQGHSRDVAGPDVPTAAREPLSYKSSCLPEYCVHGTSLDAWESIVRGARCLMSATSGSFCRQSSR